MANPLSAEQMAQLEGLFATRVATVQAELTAQLGARFDQMQAAGAGLQAELDVSRAEKAQLEERLVEAQASVEAGRRQLVAAQAAYTALPAQVETIQAQGTQFVQELRAQNAAARAEADTLRAQLAAALAMVEEMAAEEAAQPPTHEWAVTASLSQVEAGATDQEPMALVEPTEATLLSAFSLDQDRASETATSTLYATRSQRCDECGQRHWRSSVTEI